MITKREIMEKKYCSRNVKRRDIYLKINKLHKLKINILFIKFYQHENDGKIAKQF